MLTITAKIETGEMNEIKKLGLVTVVLKEDVKTVAFADWEYALHFLAEQLTEKLRELLNPPR